MAKWRKILKKAEELLMLVPTKEELQEFRIAVEQLIQELTRLEHEIHKLPSQREVDVAKNALIRIEGIMEHYRRHSPHKTPTRKKEKLSDVQITEDIVAEVRTLKELSENALISELHNKKYTNSKLALILKCLGRRASTRAKKEQLITEIVSAITSSRTYEGLAGNRRTEKCEDRKE